MLRARADKFLSAFRSFGLGGDRIRTCIFQVMSLMSWPIPLPRFLPFPSFLLLSHNAFFVVDLLPGTLHTNPIYKNKENYKQLHHERRFVELLYATVESTLPYATSSLMQFRVIRRKSPLGYLLRSIKFPFPGVKYEFLRNSDCILSYWPIDLGARKIWSPSPLNEIYITSVSVIFSSKRLYLPYHPAL